MKTIHRRLTLLIAAAALSLGAITTLLLVGARGPADPASSTSVQALYTIGQYEGQVAVFLAGQSRPDQVFDVYVASLPAEEQERPGNPSIRRQGAAATAGGLHQLRIGAPVIQPGDGTGGSRWESRQSAGGTPWRNTADPHTPRRGRCF